MRLFIALLLIGSVQVFGQMKLDAIMSQKTMQQTGVDTLNTAQKKALETWLNENFQPMQNGDYDQEGQLFLSLNIDEGTYLQLSDGKTYEVDPEDRLYTTFWITPFPVTLSHSGNLEYPVKITNLNSGTSIQGKEVSTRELLKREKRQSAQQPSPEIPAPTPAPPKTPPNNQKKPTPPKSPQPKEKQTR